MHTLPDWLPGPQPLVFLLNLAAASVLVAAAGLLTLRLCRARPAPVRHGLLLTTLLLLLASPLLLPLAGTLSWGGIALSLPQRPSVPTGDLGAAQLAAPDSSGPDRAEQCLPPAAAGPGATAIALRAVGTLLACIWAAGVVVLGMRFLRGLWALARLGRTLERVSSPDLERSAAEALDALGIGYRIPVYQTRLILTPFSLGLLRPRIVLPEDLPVHLDAEEMRYVLLHEAAHICRRDPWVALGQFGCTVLFWWNPLVRVLNLQLGRLREQLCDDHVVAAGGNGRRFARVLVRLAEWRAAPPPAPCSVALLDEEMGELEERICRLLRKKQPRELRMSRVARISVVGFALSMAGLLLISGIRATAAPAPAPKPRRQLAARQAQGLEGVWRMDLPAGFQHRVTLTRVGPNRYRLDPRILNSSGIYELRGGRLVIVAPNDRRLLGFEWELRADGRLLLVGQPPVGQTGSNYLGATMVRTQQ